MMCGWCNIKPSKINARMEDGRSLNLCWDCYDKTRNMPAKPSETRDLCQHLPYPCTQVATHKVNGMAGELKLCTHHARGYFGAVPIIPLTPPDIFSKKVLQCEGQFACMEPATHKVWSQGRELKLCAHHASKYCRPTRI